MHVDDIVISDSEVDLSELNIKPGEWKEVGGKLDKGKPRLGLVLGGFSRALTHIGRIGTVGANKYTDNGWMEVENGIDRYTDAMMRHNMSEFSGEFLDPELSEMAQEDILHAGCVAWNALARLDLISAEDFYDHTYYQEKL